MFRLANTNEKIEKKVTGCYKKIESGVVNSYKKLENAVVTRFEKVTDKCVMLFFAKNGETVQDTKKRLSENK